MGDPDPFFLQQLSIAFGSIRAADYGFDTAELAQRLCVAFHNRAVAVAKEQTPEGQP